MNKILFILLLSSISLFLPHCGQAQIITTIAGTGTGGFGGDNGPATNALFSNPWDLDVDDSGNIYVVDRINYCIRKIDKFGIITTIAGIPGSMGYNGDNAMATDAQISETVSIAVDKKHNVYICDAGNQRIRKIDTAGIITTVAGTGTPGFNGDSIPAVVANLGSPWGVAVDKYGCIYISDGFNYRIRKVDTFGIISTIAGTGTNGFSGDNGSATAAKISLTGGIAVDTSGNVYFNDNGGRIRKINISEIITTIAGTGSIGPIGDGGPATNASINAQGIDVDLLGNVYIADWNNDRLRKVDAAGIITTIAGNGIFGFSGDNGPPTLANLASPAGVVIGANGNIYIADEANQRIRCIRSNTSVDQITSLHQPLTVFPNPSSGTFTVSHPPVMPGNASAMLITDVLGRIIEKVVLQPGKQTPVILDVPDGVYFISVPGSSVAEKLVVQR